MTDVDDQFDAEADATITECLNLAEPRSFFLYAGAGSGKTRSLVNACLLYTSPSPRDLSTSRMPSSA